MPLVLATDAPTVSERAYDDVVGERYEFPARYASLVEAGETFVYYRGRRGFDDSRPRYFGTGIIGEINRSDKNDHLVAEILDYQEFSEPIPAKDAAGSYLETGSAKGTNWANGVRRIDAEAMQRILEKGTPAQDDTEHGARVSGSGFASAKHAREMERYSIAVAIAWLAGEFGAENVTEMPPCNPGYDILVRRPSAEDLFVEVKGTLGQTPSFHLSEGQRKLADIRGEDFRLLVVFQIDLETNQHRVVSLDDPLRDKRLELAPQAWLGVVHI